jgi:diguanylate cyclase (GGDEF)-like protein/PAS domain S-box-containing protein
MRCLRAMQTQNGTSLDLHLFRELVESSWNAIEVFAADGEITYAGSSTDRILGYTAEETVGKNTFDFVHPEDREYAYGVFAEVFKQPNVPIPAQLRLRHSNGTYRTVEGRLVNRLNHPEVRGIIVSYRDVTEVVSANRQLAESMAELRRVADTDGLTGLANRFSFDRGLDAAWRLCADSDSPLSIVLFDIDHFKAYNDGYGHVAGDQCLRSVAGVIAGIAKRSTDVVARYGGEEFVCVFPGTPANAARRLAESARRSVCNLRLPHAYSPTGDYVTITAGVVTRVPVREEDPWKLIREADAALYVGKKRGRNRAIVARAA